MIALVLAVVLLHTADGRPVLVNAYQIVTMREPRTEERMVSDKVRCVITLADGKYIGVLEECSAVRSLVERR